MSDPILRRSHVPRLTAQVPRTTALPGFLIATRALPMTPEPIIGPPDALEQAIMRGKVWDVDADPVEIDTFDAEDEVISVIVEHAPDDLQFDVKQGGNGVQIMMNGKPIANVAGRGQTLSRSHVRVLQPRPVP